MLLWRFFVISSGLKLDFESSLIGYCVAFATVYSLCNIGIVQAIRHGSLSITMLIYSYSLVIPAFYGVVALKEPVTVFTWTGLFLLAVSLFLLNFKNETVKISAKWIVFILMAFVGNGMCSTVQKIQQSTFDGAYKNEFMIIALFISGVFLILVSFISQKNNNPLKVLPFAACKGVANGVVNLLVMILT